MYKKPNIMPYSAFFILRNVGELSHKAMFIKWTILGEYKYTIYIYLKYYDFSGLSKQSTALSFAILHAMSKIYSESEERKSGR